MLGRVYDIVDRPNPTTFHHASKASLLTRIIAAKLLYENQKNLW